MPYSGKTIVYSAITMLKIFFLLIIFNVYPAEVVAEKGNYKKMNRLKNEKSPYLLQHADNPVDWYPWGSEAFEKAKKEDKPVLLSIGYSTCHWCHVMEHESFEDKEVADLMNDTFISIKVDREERPDIDNIYMVVCQILSQGNCGWPLNVFMTADKKPFYAATYIPKNSRYQRLGMMELVPRIKELWKNDREKLLKSADSVAETLTVAADPSRLRSSEETGMITLNRAYEQLAGKYDPKHGGFGNRPKFPTPHNLLFLLRYAQRTDNSRALDMVLNTLTKMSMGGIFDHVGFGFHRYSTDTEWLVPHFEKMLYDQALLAMAYTEAYQLTKQRGLKLTAERIFSYVMREMTSPEGGFYSAEDADSEGKEGKFYLWKEDEILDILGKSEGELILKVYNIQKEGNFLDEMVGKKTGTNILHLSKDLSLIAKELNIKVDDLEKRLEQARQKLFEYREKRIHPSKDDKVITDWNGLMITALAKGGRVFGNKSYTRAAERSVDFINRNLYKESRLLHRYRNGESGILANIDDYAFLIWGLIELYESTFDLKHLEQAIELTEQMIDLFWDKDNLGFYFTPSDGEKLLVRQKEIYDGAVPSGNSVAMYNLLKLSRMTSDPRYEKLSTDLASAFSSSLNHLPISHTMFMVALDFAVGKSYEIVISGNKDSKDTKSMIIKFRENYIPNKVVLLREENSTAIEKIALFTKPQRMINNKATAYVCENFTCQLPTNDPDKMIELIKK